MSAVSELSGEEEDNSMQPLIFKSVELLSLYTTMMLKRYVLTGLPLWEHLPYLVKVVEENLLHLGVSKKQFFATVRDHTRRYHHEWKMGNKTLKGQHTAGQRRFNTYLLVLGLHSGLEELIPPDDGAPIYNELMKKELRAASNSEPVLSLKKLNQAFPNYEYLACHSPNLEEINMPNCDPPSFETCMKFRNLKVLKFSGGVMNQELCNALWNIKKRSEEVMELALRDVQKVNSWHLSLPHLEVLDSDEKDIEAFPLSVGMVAVFVQPKLQVVQCFTWNTFIAILCLLNVEGANQKLSKARGRLAVSQLVISSSTAIANMGDVGQVLKFCPKLTNLTLTEVQYLGENSIYTSLLYQLLPMENITKLTLHTVEMTPEQFVVLLASMKNVDKLTLKVTTDSIYHLCDATEKNFMVRTPKVTKLKLEFVPKNGPQNVDLGVFLRPFIHLRELTLCNVMHVEPNYLVRSCMLSVVRTMKDLDHLGVIYGGYLLPSMTTLQHPSISYGDILASVMEESEKSFCNLKSMEIDEYFLNAAIDSRIESLRMAGVEVNVRYNWLPSSFS